MNTAPDKIYSLGSVDVNAIDPYTKRIGLNVHIECLPHEMQTEQIVSEATVMADRKIKYLVAEGFLDNVQGWNAAIDIVGHVPRKK